MSEAITNILKSKTQGEKIYDGKTWFKHNKNANNHYREEVIT